MASKNTHWNEATRVQMPALVHLTRIGYTYFGKISEDKAGVVYDPDTNILIEVFKEQFARLNPDRAGEAEAMLRTIRQELDNDDIGESFYKRLKAVSPVKLVDFEHPQNNTYHCTAEFTCKRDEDEFRPDITLFVNGLPLVFIEVKKPNNVGGMVAEANRMNHQRFPNKKFRRFINITQLMIFSNNMEYDALGGILFVEGPDDERFLRHIYHGKNVQYVLYRNNAKKDINDKLRSIKHSPICDYLFFADADGCSIEDRIQRTIEKYQDCDREKVCVVQFEIESWYLAGIRQDISQKMKIKQFSCTDNVRKEQFNSIIPKQYARVDFMMEILKHYDCEVAKSRNASFKLFFDRSKEQAV